MSNVTRGALIAAPLMILVAHAAPAAPKRLRLTVDVKVEGTESVIGTGADQTHAKFREGYTLVTYLQADGDLEQFNTKDPQYGQKMMGMAAGVHAKVNQAQGKAPAKKMSQEEIQAYVTKKQAACGADTSCLMKLGQEANDLMMANINAGTESGASPAYTGDEPPRYLTYLGYDNCGAKVHTYVDRLIEGTLADTVTVPYTIKETVNYDNNPVELGLICNFHQAVYDTKDGTFWTDGAIAPHYKGTETTTMRGKTTTSTATEFGHGEPFNWISEQLRHPVRAGHKTTTMKLTQNQGAAIHSGRYSGQATVDLTWKFEDVR
ncbi:MAG TPA: hypothetical protein VMF52_02345 [Steroidobacteraceae bacterium]|nr:hypothetical protein [Steroidobacteraceae bacterium]